MGGHPPDGGATDPTLDLGAGGRNGPVRTAGTGGQWWRQRPVQFGIAAVALAAVVVGVLLARDGDGVVTVPDVTGMQVADAVADLAASGLDATTELVEGLEGVEPGTVVAQEPVAGAVVDPGSQVRLQVAGLPPNGDEDVEVPDVVGLTVGEATAALAAVGLEARVERVPAREGMAAGTVLAQDPAPQTLVRVGSEVHLEVAEEPPDNTSNDDNDDGAVRNVITWILGLAPSAPSGPSEFRAYELLRDRDCAPVIEQLDSGDLNVAADAEALYRGTAAACLAAFHGAEQRWGDAERALNAVDPASQQLLCFDAAIYSLLERLVTARRENPDGEFVADSDGGAAGAPPCPTVTGLAPAEGPRDTVLELTGTNLHHVGRVDFIVGEISEDDVTPTEVAHDRLRVTVPALNGVDRPARLCVAVVVEGPGWSWQVAGEPFLLLPDDPAEEAGEVAGTDSPCPPPPEN